MQHRRPQTGDFAMLFSRATAVCLALLASCDEYLVPKEGAVFPNQCTDAAAPPDLAPPAPKCLAAKGLSGDNLVCVDFAKVPSLTDQTLTGWDFVSIGGGNYWELAGGKLQVKNFGTFADTCGFKMPAINFNDADKQKYNTYILSVVHRVSISEADAQKIQVMLGSDDPQKRLITQWTGKQPSQQTTIVISKADLLMQASNFQPLFKFSASATAGGSFSGWQIDSIAVNASP
jgi:hypothetical protein